MKILEIIPQLGQGGAERFVVDLCNELSKDHKIILVVLYSLDKAGFFCEELCDRVELISMNKKKGMDLGLFFRLNRLIHRQRPDIVHTHLRAISYSGLAFFLKEDIKFIHTIHSDAVKEAGNGISKWCRKFAFRTRRVHPVTISEESQQSFADLYHLKSSLIYNGRPAYNDAIDISRISAELAALKQNKDARLIVNVARIQQAKNQVELAKAVISLNKKGKRIELVIIGSVVEPRLEQKLVQLNSPYVHLLGTRTNPRDYMRAADAFCLSSIYEGMPITLIESFSVGTIPICTPVGGIRNMIQDGVNGLLACSPSREDIEAVLKRFMNYSDPQINSMKMASKESFKNYNMETCCQNYVGLMMNILNSESC